MKPWEKYKSVGTAVEEGPWTKYAAPAAVDPDALLKDHANSLDYKMAVAQGKQAESLPQYAGRFVREGALPTLGAAAGSAIGGIPGAMAGAALGETVSQATGLTPAGSVIPEANNPDLGRVAMTGAMQGAVPLSAAAAKRIYGTAKGLVEPFYHSGREAIIGRTLNTASGGQKDAVAKALVQARELVPGSLPTAGQAANNAGIASLERAASAIDPTVTVEYANRIAEQNAARTWALRGIAGTEADRAFAEHARKASTAPLLDTLKNSPAQVDPSRTVGLIDDMLQQYSGRPKLTNALQQVKSSLFNADGSLKSNPLQLYQGPRTNITDMLAEKAGDGSKLNAAISRQLSVVMKSLDSQIGKAEPAYKAFMHDYAEMSKPINRMEVGSKILEKSTDRLTGETIRPESFGAALSDKTAQQATGFKRATLDKTMTPQQMQTLEAVRDDLARAVMAQKQAGTAGSDTVKKLAYSNLIDRAGVPTFLREFAPTQVIGNILARGGDAAYSAANRDLSHQLAMTLLDPKEAARVMGKAMPSRYDAIIEELLKRGAPVTSATASQLANQRN